MYERSCNFRISISFEEVSWVAEVIDVIIVRSLSVSSWLIDPHEEPRATKLCDSLGANL